MKSMKPSFAYQKMDLWNAMFWSILDTCNLKLEFSSCSLPSSYWETQICGHILHVGLEDTSTNTMYLTMLELSKDPTTLYNSHVPALFIYCTVLNNPVWDLGLQFLLPKTNNDKAFTCEVENLQLYSTKYIGPCSSIL